MVGVDGTDGGLEAVVEGGKADVFGVAGLVEGVVPGYPGVVLVAGGDLLPQPDCAVLVVLGVVSMYCGSVDKSGVSCADSCGQLQGVSKRFH